MLETLGKSQLPLSENVENRENQQQTVIDLAYYAGLMEGEGSFNITKNNERSGKRMFRLRAGVQFTNTDTVLVENYASFLDKFGIHYHVNTRTPDKSHHRVCYNITVTHLESLRELLELFIPYLRGIKLSEAKLILRFVSGRIQKNLVRNRVRDVDGRYTSQEIDDEDITLYTEYKNMKQLDAQRLHVSHPIRMKI